MTADEQEALSRKYSDDVIIMLPLKSGNIAVFNNARELTGITEKPIGCNWWDILTIEKWHKPASVPQRTASTSRPTLEDLDL